jgi:hypothetical protein
VIAPHINSYEVLYLVYVTKTLEYHQLPFEKSYLQRALWIRELLLDIETIKMYEEAGIYPMHGESCYDFYRECQYLNLCTLSTAVLTEPYEPTEDEEFSIELTLQQIVEAQLEKTT